MALPSRADTGVISIGISWAQENVLSNCWPALVTRVFRERLCDTVVLKANYPTLSSKQVSTDNVWSAAGLQEKSF